MKNREGFISNSSTTSYLILVKPEKVESVDFILRSLHNEKTMPSKSVKEFRKGLLDEIKEIKKDIAYVEELKGKLIAGVANQYQYSFHAFLNMLEALSFHKDRIRTMRDRPIRDQVRNYEYYATELNRVKVSLQKKMDDYEKQIKALEGNEGWSIIAFDDDANWGALKGMVEDLLSSKNAIIISKETS